MNFSRALRIPSLFSDTAVQRYRSHHSTSIKIAIAAGLGLVCVMTAQSRAQTVTAVLQKNAAAFSPSGTAPTSITFNGMVAWTAGSTQESGTVQLTSVADGSANESWTLPTQSRSVVLTALAGIHTCTVVDASSKTFSITDSNCSRVLPWFSPWIAGPLVTSALTVATYATQPADSSAGVERLTFTPAASLGASSATSPIAQFLQLAAVSVLYDGTSGLPTAIEYAQVVDSEPAHALQIRVVFSDYRSESGYMVPHHLQRYVQRTLQSDVTITSVTAE